MKSLLKGRISRLLISIIAGVFIPVPIYDSCMSACGPGGNVCTMECVRGFRFDSIATLFIDLMTGVAVNDVNIDWSEILLVLYFMIFYIFTMYGLLGKWAGDSFSPKVHVKDWLKNLVSSKIRRLFLVIFIVALIPIPFYSQDWDSNLSLDTSTLQAVSLETSAIHFVPIIYGIYKMIRISMVYKHWIYSIYHLFYPILFYTFFSVKLNNFLKGMSYLKGLEKE